MPVTSRDIEKLKAIGYTVSFDGVAYDCFLNGKDILEHSDWEFEDMAWGACKAHAQSPDGMKATMADKVRWLREHGPLWSSVHIETEFGSDGPTGWATAEQKAVENGKVVSCIQAGGPSDEAAVDALFWKVP